MRISQKNFKNPIDKALFAWYSMDSTRCDVGGKSRSWKRPGDAERSFCISIGEDAKRGFCSRSLFMVRKAPPRQHAEGRFFCFSRHPPSVGRASKSGTDPRANLDQIIRGGQ